VAEWVTDVHDFRGKVAVITGAASGIGRAVADRCAQEGMKVVLAGINRANLAQAEEELKGTGATVLSVPTDVSKARDVEALARKTLDALGSIHLLFNNAGVGAGTTVWESTVADWEWVIGVNLWGVIHGIRVFVPIMLRQDTECHIVNTASILGLVSGPGSGVYKVTKHGVVSVPETLACELAGRGARIGVSVLCPGWVNTRIVDSARNRPPDLQNPLAPVSPEVEAAYHARREAALAGMSPQLVANHVFQAIRTQQFYILTHPDQQPWIQKRMEDILGQRNPA
jgi:NAD(P)-dependent dehydrogenase (short-subunit alcohol dehydrogenase family)